VENNKAGGRVSRSTLHISWPYEVESGHSDGKRLLYLMDPPKVRGLQCYFSSTVNVRFTGEQIH